jgi:hypothetical protein
MLALTIRPVAAWSKTALPTDTGGWTLPRDPPTVELAAIRCMDLIAADARSGRAVSPSSLGTNSSGMATATILGQRTPEDSGAGLCRRVTAGDRRYRKLQITHRSPKGPRWT